MPAKRFSVRVTKDHLVFSAAHFITFGGNVCERLHGHNWRVAVSLEGPLDENRYVFDFIVMRDALQRIVNELDHHVLLPTLHPAITVAEENGEVVARFETRRWVFPREDCVLLPIENTTAELIADWIAGRILELLPTDDRRRLETIRVDVEENFGQWGIVERDVADN